MRKLLMALAILPLLAQAEEVVHVYNWEDYIDPQVISDFQKDTGIRVDYHTFSTSEEANALLDGDTPIDVYAPSHDELKRLIRENKLQKLNTQQLPNTSKLDPYISGILNSVDPGNHYAVPYLWGAVGLAINVPKAQEAFGGPLPESWSVLFDPEQIKRLSKCGVNLLDDPIYVASILMNYQGNIPERSSPAQMEKIAKDLMSIRPYVRSIDNDATVDAFKNGQLCVAMVYSVGDAINARKTGQPVSYVVPQEGTYVFVDTLVIPSKTRNPELAHRFINYVMSARSMARITEETSYPNANLDSMKLLSPELQKENALYPNGALRRRLFALVPPPAETRQTFEGLWQTFKQAH
ncbi:extracellular solute-binding protein [Pseudomonas luteola]